jgi:uncharacterized protein YbjT (DUF2867 family)
MRVAVAGASGRIGHFTVAALERGGHEAVAISRSAGVDAYTGDGLDAALARVDAVVDCTNTAAGDEAAVVDFFTTCARNLLSAGERAAIRHYVLLSIVGVDRVETNAHYAGKRAQEKAVADGPLPWTIVRATQFHDFAAMIVEWTLQDGAATIAPLLVQPIAPADVGDVLAEVAVNEPANDRVEIAGPETQDLVDMARRTLAARGEQVKLVPTWRGPLDVSMAGEVALPGPDARLCGTTFDDWLAAGAR